MPLAAVFLVVVPFVSSSDFRFSFFYLPFFFFFSFYYFFIFTSFSLVDRQLSLERGSMKSINEINLQKSGQDWKEKQIDQAVGDGSISTSLHWISLVTVSTPLAPVDGRSEVSMESSNIKRGSFYLKEWSNGGYNVTHIEPDRRCYSHSRRELSSK